MNTIILKLILKFVADSCFDIKLSDDNGKYKCVNNKCGRTNPVTYPHKIHSLSRKHVLRRLKPSGRSCFPDLASNSLN